jgi:ribonuclease VapC
VVLDAWSVIALLRDEPGAAAVERAIAGGGALMSWINVGEVLYIESRAAGETAAAGAVDALVRQVDVRDADAELVLAAARIKARHRLSYADAFAVALAQRSHAPLLTGDPELLALECSVPILDPRAET